MKFLIILMFLSSCGILLDSPGGSGWQKFEPRPLTGTRNFPSTDTEYGRGFKNGCGFAYKAVAKGLLSRINDAKNLDAKAMAGNADYNLGWFDGYEQCTYILDWDVT